MLQLIRASGRSTMAEGVKLDLSGLPIFLRQPDGGADMQRSLLSRNTRERPL